MLARSVAGTWLAAVVASAFCAGPTIADDKQLGGRWIMGDGGGVLVIRGSSWFHPKHGAGQIKRGKGAADYDVFYTQHQGVRCAYRVYTAAGGEILVLDAADSTQSPDFCPSGRLSRVSN